MISRWKRDHQERYEHQLQDADAGGELHSYFVNFFPLVQCVRINEPYILKARIAGFIIPQKNLNFPQISSKMPQNGPTMAKNDPKWPKVAQI